jgi:hypothetical protein
LIKGDFSAGTLDVNGDLTVNGFVRANQYFDADGNALIQKNAATGEVTITTSKIVDTTNVSYVRKDATTGSVHIGQNSFVFDDASGSIGNGVDIMSSSVGKLQIGRNATDVTSFVGSVNVPKPTQGSNAANMSYVDGAAALAAAMDTRLPANGLKNNLSIGIAGMNEQQAMALNYVSIIDQQNTFIDWSASLAQSNYSGTMARIGIGFSW